MSHTLRLCLYTLAILSLTTGSALAQSTLQKDLSMNGKVSPYGIAGRQAPELTITQWVDAAGEPGKPFTLAAHEGKFRVIYCFQAWCPGCHSRGLPALKEMSAALSDNPKVTFTAIQTVFEGAHANTYERMLEIQKQYGLEIPFGHDPGGEGQHISSTMQSYATGGTPWFIFIDQQGQVVFNDFHLNTQKAIEFLQTVE